MIDFKCGHLMGPPGRVLEDGFKTSDCTSELPSFPLHMSENSVDT